MAAATIADHVLDRCPEISWLRWRKMKIRRKHTDNCVGMAVKYHRLTQHVVASPKTPLPCGIAQQNSARSGFLVFTRTKITPQDRRDTQSPEKSIADASSVSLMCSACILEHETVWRIYIQRLKNRVLPLPVHVIRIGKMKAQTKRNAFKQNDQPVRVLVRQRLNKRCIDKSKDRDTRTNTKGQNENRSRRKASIFAKLSLRKPEILHHALEPESDSSAALVSQPCIVSESPIRSVARILVGHSQSEKLFLRLLPMEGHLFFKLAVELIASDKNHQFSQETKHVISCNVFQSYSVRRASTGFTEAARLAGK